MDTVSYWLHIWYFTLHKGMDRNSCTKFGRVASSQSLFIGSPKKQGDKRKLLKNWICHSFWTLSCIALIFDTEHKSMDPNSYIKFDHVSSFQSLSIGLSRKKPDNAIFCRQYHINVFCSSKKVLAKTKNRLFVSKHIVKLLHGWWFM